MIDGRGEPIVMDFGLARRLDGPAPRLTGTGQTLGTPAYMAPEQVHGDPKQIGPATDMYSLGVILYELLTGRLPFEGPFAAVLVLVGDQKPPPPSTLRTGLDPRLEAICLRCLAPHPKDRFADMAELATALAAVAEPEPSLSPSPARSPTALLAGAAAMVGLVCGVVGFLVLQPPPTPHSPAEQALATHAVLPIEASSAPAITAPPSPLAHGKEGPPQVLSPIGPKPEPTRSPAPEETIALPRPPPPDPAVHYQRGHELAAAGRPKEAVAEFSKTLDLGQRTVAVYRERGLAYLELKDLAAALDDLNVALKLDPGDAEAHCARGRVLAGRGEHVAAVHDFQAAIERAPDRFEAHRALGDAYRDLGENAKAEAVYTRALELRPKDCVLYLDRGRVRFRQRRFAEAIDDYDEAIDRLGWKKAQAYRLRAEAFLGRDYLTRAQEDLTQALNLAPDDAIAYYLRGQIRSRSRDFAAAYSDFSEASRADPGNPVYPYERGRAAVALDDPDRAILDFDDAIRLGENHSELPVFLLDRGNTHRQTGNFPKALVDYRRALELRPRFAQVFRERGIVHFLMKSSDAARADFGQAILLEPKNADSRFWRGQYYDRAGATAAALADYDEAIKLAPKVAAHHEARGSLNARTGRYKEALQDYSRAIQHAPDRVVLYMKRTHVYLALEEYDGVLSDCAVVLKRDPKNADAYYLRGLAQQAKRQGELAIAAYTEALRWNPNLFAAHLNRGSLYAGRGQPGDFDRAIADFSEAHRIDPQAPLPLQNRAAVYERQGRKDLAEQDRARLKSLGR
jgi:tetratricopeptide (TPR) repeat protein